jgi:enoyl-CoA hydratase/carnithine racemase
VAPEFLLTGDRIDAERAERLGLVNVLTEPARFSPARSRSGSVRAFVEHRLRHHEPTRNYVARRTAEGLASERSPAA